MNKNNYLKSYPGKGIAVGNNCLDKTPFVPRSCSLMEWRATCFGDRCLLTGVLEREQLRAVGVGAGADPLSAGLWGDSQGLLEVRHSLTTLQPVGPNLRDKANPLVLMFPYKVWLRTAVLRYLVSCPRSLSKMVAEPALEFFPWWWHVVFWTSDAITSPGFGVWYLVCLPMHKPSQEWLTLCVLPVTLKLLTPSGLDRY